MNPTDFEIEVFFDGHCPLCGKEIRLLRRLDRHHRIRFTDIAAQGFEADRLGIPWDHLMDRIHGRLHDGTIVEGLEVFRRLYAAVGFGWLVAWTRLPLLSHLLELLYRWFAKNRLRLTGRCSAGTCSTDGG